MFKYNGYSLGEIMQTLSKTKLSPKNHKALKKLKELLEDRFSVCGLIAFGSVVRGESDDESDLDLLVITNEPFSRTKRHLITDLVFEVNLKYGTNISSTVVDNNSWENGLFSVLPIKEEVERDGVIV